MTRVITSSAMGLFQSQAAQPRRIKRHKASYIIRCDESKAEVCHEINQIIHICALCASNVCIYRYNPEMCVGISHIIQSQYLKNL